MNNGLLLGLGALVVGGGIAWLAFNDDSTGPGIHPDDMRLNDWATANSILVVVPHDRTLSPRTAQPDGAFDVQAIGDTSSRITLVYFPSTDSLHVNSTGFPIDQAATQSWRAYKAQAATLANAASLVNSPRNTSTPNGSILLNFTPIG